MHSEIKRRLLDEVVQDNLATGPSTGPTVTTLEPRAARRSLWVRLGQVGCLAAALVLVPLNERSTGIAPRVESRLEAPAVTISTSQVEPFSLASDSRIAVEQQGAALEAAVDLLLLPIKASLPMVETGGLPEPTYPAPLPIDPAVLALEVRKIVLDPGHGGKDLGISTPTGLSEKEITLDVGLRLRALLAQAGYDDAERSQVRAVVGVPAEALRVSRQHLRQAMKDSADCLMIVSEPFAVAYGLEALLHTLIIDIGAGTTDFCVMNGHYPTDEEQRTLALAGDAVEARLTALLRERHPEAQFSIHMVREWKEKWSFVGAPTTRAFVTVPVVGKPTRLDITSEIRLACESLVPPVVETMLELLARVEPEYQEKVRYNITLAGGGSQIFGLGQALEQALNDVGGGRVQTVNDAVFAGADGGLALALDAVEADWERLVT